MTVAKKADAQVIETIVETLGVLHPANTGDIWEIRAPDTRGRGTVSGYYSDPEQCARDVVAHLDGKTPGVYVTLNQINPALLARAVNRLKDYAKPTTSDSVTDVTKRLWLPLDFDPDRPAGISANEIEHDEGLARAAQAAAFLREQGWTDPVRADSGNGGHLLYPISLPNDRNSETLIKRVLEALARRFDEPPEPRAARVHLDTSVSNAGRILKLYGTVAGKGDNAPALDRPHRRARLMSVPTVGGLVTRGQLEDLCKILAPLPGTAEHSASGANQRTRRTNSWIEDADAYLRQHGIAIWHDEPISDGHKWVLDACVWNSSHTNHSAFVIQRTSDGAISAGCLHDSCRDKHLPEFRDAVEPGWRTAVSEMYDGIRPLVGSDVQDHYDEDREPRVEGLKALIHDKSDRTPHRDHLKADDHLSASFLKYGRHRCA